jgi:hypothetical protein
MGCHLAPVRYAECGEGPTPLSHHNEGHHPDPDQGRAQPGRHERDSVLSQESGCGTQAQQGKYVGRVVGAASHHGSR